MVSSGRRFGCYICPRSSHLELLTVFLRVSRTPGSYFFGFLQVLPEEYRNMSQYSVQCLVRRWIRVLELFHGDVGNNFTFFYVKVDSDRVVDSRLAFQSRIVCCTHWCATAPDDVYGKSFFFNCVDSGAPLRNERAVCACFLPMGRWESDSGGWHTSLPMHASHCFSLTLTCAHPIFQKRLPCPLCRDNF